MPLPSPSLDDRHFQDLVYDAKRLMAERCPGWTDHNVSDPGVTLIEAMATQVDQLIYRLNRVPDRLHRRFLDLLGVQQRPPTAATGSVTFWLSSPQPDTVTVPAGTLVSTGRAEQRPEVAFATTADVAAVPSTLGSAVVVPHRQSPVDASWELLRREVRDAAVPMFRRSGAPQVGDAFLLGLEQPVPSCAVLLRFTVVADQGSNVTPEHPPYRWEALVGGEWTVCECSRDTTQAMNRDGEVLLHVPAGHDEGRSEAGTVAAWLRCAVREHDEAAGETPYTASPQLRQVEASTIGATGPVGQVVELVREEHLGTAEGVPGQRMSLSRQPVVGPNPLVLEVLEGDTWREWRRVERLGEHAFVLPRGFGTGPQESWRDGRRVFTLDAVAGEVVFGPAVREPDGSLRCYGAFPPPGARVRIREYRTGGGEVGNVGEREIKVLKSSVPFVSRVTNRVPASGGREVEPLEDTLRRGALELRTRDRAVTAPDFEHLAAAAHPRVARAFCELASSGGHGGRGDTRPTAPGVLVRVVPVMSSGPLGELAWEQREPPDDVLAAVAAELDRCRLLGVRVGVRPAEYVAVSCRVGLVRRAGSDPSAVVRSALVALYRGFHPYLGGPDSRGWPPGRRLTPGDVYAVLAGLPDVLQVADVRLAVVEDPSGGRSAAARRAWSEVHEVVFPPSAVPVGFGHEVSVTEQTAG